MSADPTRSEALRAAGFAAEIDTQDPPGKVTVVFDLADFDALIGALVDGRPRDVVSARAEGVAEGRAEAEATATLNARHRLTAELVAEAARSTAALVAKVDDLARQYGVPKDPKPEIDPRVRAALVGSGPTGGSLAKGRLRTPAEERPEDDDGPIQPTEASEEGQGA